MLSVNSYSQDFIDACRANVAVQMSTYADVKALTAAAPEDTIAAFERSFFRHMILALDRYFCHRARTLEKKDGNPCNEVRVLCTSITDHDGVLAADKTIKLKPETSVLGLAVGDEIALSAADFERLAEAFFAEIAVKYP